MPCSLGSIWSLGTPSQAQTTLVALRLDFRRPAPRISAPSSPNLVVCCPNLASSSPNLSASSPNFPEQRDLEGCLVAGQLPFPVVDDLAPL